MTPTVFSVMYLLQFTFMSSSLSSISCVIVVAEGRHSLRAAGKENRLNTGWLPAGYWSKLQLSKLDKIHTSQATDCISFTLREIQSNTAERPGLPVRVRGSCPPLLISSDTEPCCVPSAPPAQAAVHCHLRLRFMCQQLFIVVYVYMGVF